MTRNDKHMTITNILGSKSIQAAYVVAGIPYVDKLAGRSDTVTGGASGIGRACAIRLAREGVGIVIGNIRDEQAAETVDLVRAAGGKAIAVHLGEPHAMDHERGKIGESVNLTDQGYQTLMDFTRNNVVLARRV